MKRIVILVAAVIMALQPSIVFAEGETFRSENDIIYVAPTPVCPASDATGTGQGVEVSSENAEAILTFLTGKGLSLAAAAGIAGNLNAESSLNPAKIQGGEIADDNVDIMTLTYTDSTGTHQLGFGLAQWTSEGRKRNLVNYAKSQNVKITDLTMQLNFLWRELGASYGEVLSRLNAERTDPVAAAIIFHGMTPNIQAEGSSINPVFTAANPPYPGFEGSADTSDEVVNTRGGFAKSFYDRFHGQIEDGTGVADVTPTDEVAISSTPAACEDANGNTQLGVGQGDFIDNGQVRDWDNVLHNAQASEAAFGDSLVGDGWCAAISSRVWRGQNIGYGYERAIDMWDAEGARIGHADRSPKKGALLIYRANHVAIYLGNNKILNDGHIDNANFPEVSWHLTYVGWIDPTELGWNSIATDNIREAVGEYGNG